MPQPLFQAPRGTADILPLQQKHWRYVHSTAEMIAQEFGYERVDTPLFEDARLFVRGIGEVTDIVEKETYTFEDRGGDLITLRPEGTAPVCRAYLEHGMRNLSQPVRLYYVGPFFRYERPQAGRYRQLHQFGIEVLGDGDAAIDAEVIEVAWRFLEVVGVEDLTLVLNSIGDSLCRPRYIENLRAHYEPSVDSLCSNCKRRLEHNPLRLLDCKEDSCQPVIDGAPDFIEFLCEACGAHWDSLLRYLGALGLRYEVDKRLVRGFDYYTRTVFEIVPPVEGRQSTIAAGGRYDDLIEELGGPSTRGIGFAMGMERVVENLIRQNTPVPDRAGIKVLVAHIGDDAKLEGLSLSSELRRGRVPALLAPSERGLRSQLRYASSVGATHAVIIGEEELRKGVAIVRDLARSEQREVLRPELVALFQDM